MEISTAVTCWLKYRTLKMKYSLFVRQYSYFLFFSVLKKGHCLSPKYDWYCSFFVLPWSWDILQKIYYLHTVCASENDRFVKISVDQMRPATADRTQSYGEPLKFTLPGFEKNSICCLQQEQLDVWKPGLSLVCFRPFSKQRTYSGSVKVTSGLIYMAVFVRNKLGYEFLSVTAGSHREDTLGHKCLTVVKAHLLVLQIM